MSTRSPKLQLFAEFANVAKALGHEHRLALIEILGQGERSVEDAAKAVGLPIANASQHLHRLQRAGLVVARKAGKHVFYGLSEADAVIPLVRMLQRVAERNVAEIERVLAGYFRQRDGLEPVGREELLARSRKGEVTVLDVRPAGEYARGHLPGALNIPVRELGKRLAELPPGQDIVAYCRGPYCVMSFEAVAALRPRGFNIRRFEDGYPEWAAAGYPVESAPRG
ncbi:MAG: metalloregulator ArsR/SmtB family transcription factor [Rhodospirillales bacterium]|nr:metalloregulator ArsR/SmtB family transcription factor [Rhodospirillales bacterium]